MFSRQKKSFFKRKGFYLVLAAVLAFGFWMNLPDDVLPSDDIQTDVNQPVDTNRDKDNGGGKDAASTDKNGGASEQDPQNSKDDPQKDDVNPSAGEYYLVKEIDGIIKVFYYDESGGETLLQDTDIAFSLISEGDQALFSEGIILQSKDDLLSLLQDFES